MSRALRVAGVVLLSLVAGVFFLAVLAPLSGCATPAILVDPSQGPCGEYPEYCDAEHTRCCPERNACTVNGCEFTGRARVRDAGAE